MTSYVEHITSHTCINIFIILLQIFLMRILLTRICSIIDMQVLKKRSTVSVHGTSVRQGLSDVALCNDDARSVDKKHIILNSN